MRSPVWGEVDSLGGCDGRRRADRVLLRSVRVTVPERGERRRCAGVRPLSVRPTVACAVRVASLWSAVKPARCARTFRCAKSFGLDSVRRSAWWGLAGHLGPAERNHDVPPHLRRPSSPPLVRCALGSRFRPPSAGRGSALSADHLLWRREPLGSGPRVRAGRPRVSAAGAQLLAPRASSSTSPRPCCSTSAAASGPWLAGPRSIWQGFSARPGSATWRTRSWRSAPPMPHCASQSCARRRHADGRPCVSVRRHSSAPSRGAACVGPAPRHCMARGRARDRPPVIPQPALPPPRLDAEKLDVYAVALELQVMTPCSCP